MPSCRMALSFLTHTCVFRIFTTKIFKATILKSLKNVVPSSKVLRTEKIVNGAIAGVVGCSCVFPLDLVKTRLQNQSIGPDGQKQYRNMFDCFKKTVAREGFRGLYSGIVINLILVSPEKAFKLAANDYFRFHLTQPDGSLSLPRQMLAGGLAGIAQASISCPMELLKIQMQDAGRATVNPSPEQLAIKKMSSIQLSLKLLRERGIFGLYKGIGPTTIREVFFNVIYFPLFASLNELKFDKPGGSAPSWWSFVCGIASGATAAWTLTPMDVVKTRLQTLNKAKGEQHYSSAFDCITRTFKNEGMTAFFKGGACRVIVIAPLYGIVQAVYFLGVAEALGVK